MTKVNSSKIDEISFDDEERKAINKTVINFREEGIVIAAHDIHSIEKETKFADKPKAHFEYGIVINKGLNQSQYINKINLSMWYMKEDVRDKKFEKIMTILESEGLKVIEI